MKHRIYVAAPYSADPLFWVDEANAHAMECMRRGHLCHCPHMATEGWEANDIGYEDILALDFSIINHWATALLYLAPSPGADRELALAESLGLRIFRSVAEVPDLRDIYSETA